MAELKGQAILFVAAQFWMGHNGGIDGITVAELGRKRLATIQPKHLCRRVLAEAPGRVLRPSPHRIAQRGGSVIGGRQDGVRACSSSVHEQPGLNQCAQYGMSFVHAAQGGGCNIPPSRTGGRKRAPPADIDILEPPDDVCQDCMVSK